MTTPKLRFKEFKNNWLKTNLGEVVKFSNGKRVPLSESERQKRQGAYRYYGASGVIDYIDDYLFDGDYILIGEDGANIITRSSTLAFVVTGKFWVNNHAHIFQSKEGNNIFLATYLESLNFEKFNSGTAQPKLNLENLKKVPVANPSKEEQTKIASFFSTVDEKISQLTQKHDLLSQYKQGMMQKLFSQQIRFKADDGSEFGEWGNLKIFDLAKDKTLNNGVFNDQNKVGKGYKLINVLDMYINRDIDESRLKLLDLSKKEFEKNKVYYGDIFFTRSSLVKEGIAFSNVYLGNSNDVTYDGHLIKLTPDLDRVSPIFLNYVLKTNAVRKQLIKGGKTATMTTIGQQEVGNTMVPLPCLEEQTKIANFLSAIDQKIKVVAQQIEQAKTWKKGLLQQMFV